MSSGLDEQAEMADRAKTVQRDEHAPELLLSPNRYVCEHPRRNFVRGPAQRQRRQAPKKRRYSVTGRSWQRSLIHESHDLSHLKVIAVEHNVQ